MVLTEKLLAELQKRLKIGSRKSVHLNALPARSRYKFDISRLALIDKKMPDRFINALLTHIPMKFRISWKETAVDLNSMLEEEQEQLVRITDSFEYLVNQTEAIEQEKGINTFGFGFPLLIRRDKKDGQLTVAPILIWSLRIKRTKEFNTWEILRNDDDPVHINEVLINYLESDSGIIIDRIPHEMLDHGLIGKGELIDLCVKMIRSIGTLPADDIKENFGNKLENIVPIKDKKHYERLPLTDTNVLVEFGGLLSIFEVQKQNVINDYNSLVEMTGLEINLDDMENHTFQSISSVETDPSQQSILRSLESSRNILIQGPPGTGKSQTLTAILVNALENDRKTIVVCEKRTALEVLYNALAAKGLKGHCVLVRDIIKDRRAVVDSVRERVDSPGYRRYIYGLPKDELNNIIVKAKSLIESINRKHRKLDAGLIGSKSWTDVVGNLLAELKGCNDDVNLNLNHELFMFDGGELETLLTVVQRGGKLYGDYHAVKEYSFINPEKFVGDNPFAIEQQIGKDFEDYTRLLNEVKQLFEAVRADYFKLRQSELESQTHLIESDMTAVNDKESELEGLIITAGEEYVAFRNHELHRQIAASEEWITGIDLILSRNEGNNDLTDTVKVSGFGFKFLALFSKRRRRTVADQKELLELLTGFRIVIDGCRDFREIRISGDLAARKTAFERLKRHIDTTKDTFPSTIQKEFESLKLHSALNTGGRQTVFRAIRGYIDLPDVSQPCSDLLHSFEERTGRYLDGMDALFAKLSQDLSSCRDFNLAYTFGDEFPENKTLLPEINNQLKNVAAGFQEKIESEFAGLHLLNCSPEEIELPHLLQLRTKAAELAQRIASDKWSSAGIEAGDPDKFIAAVDALIHRKNNYFNLGKDLFIPEFKWFQFYGTLDSLHRLVIDELKSKSDWRKTILVFYLNALLLRHASVDLPSGDEEHRELSEVLSNMEREQLKYIRQLWQSKQIDKARQFMFRNNLSVGNLYNKRSSQNFKRLSLRQIVQKDAGLFTTFFPIILTSPDVACSLFKGMNGYFDMVMFDEASQLRLEDNLPALLKGKQIVVAGDEHQMPPSNYFSKVFEGSVEDEDEVEEEGAVVIDKDNLYLSCESLIDFASELNFKRNYLDFHYRSRHPYLIDFSNYAFYNRRLKPLPNNFDYVPVKYIQVNGTFAEYTNEAEAETVLSIIDRNIRRLPDGKYPTVGIATFNITQRNLIIRKIQERRKSDQYDAFNAKVQELLTDGMFVKNLENIQGDERDVIILSTTYGTTPEGKFAQRFGPINHSKGYKLLNVIITRAKYKIYVCSSIPENMFMHYRDSLANEGANNRRAVLYAYLAYCKAVSEEDDTARYAVLTALAENTAKSAGIESSRDNGETESPFEKEVYHALSEYLDTDKLTLRMSFAGFMIDLVYDPGIPGVPKVAIECDGAKFHSDPEAYLYDTHRQKILERYGFVFHRIWSTNWWRNPGKEVTRLAEFIRQVESSPAGAVKDYSGYAGAFTDDVDIIRL